MLKAFEDLGYYSVDNLPIDLIPKFAELTKDAPNVRRAALVVDIREGVALERFPALYKKNSPADSYASAVSRSRRCRADPPVQRNAPPSSSGHRAKRRSEHHQRARAPGADSRAGRSDHQHHQVQRP